MQFSLIALIFASLPAYAWDHHQAIMESIAETPYVAAHFPLSFRIKVPSLEEEGFELKRLALLLQIDEARVPRMGKVTASETTFGDLFSSSAIDEPDMGMDQDLPEMTDGVEDRAWMGGSKGSTSQGFRHMRFMGVHWSRPLATFQLPMRPIGQALERIDRLGALSSQYFKEGKFFWGVRLLLWKLHYVQDLHQPFHVLQVPYYRLLPWNKLFKSFVSEATHSIGNYHFAFESLAREWVSDPGDEEFKKCLRGEDVKTFSLTDEILALPQSSGVELGKILFQIFGNELKKAEVDLPENKGDIDAFQWVHLTKPNLSVEELAEMSSEDRKDIEKQNEKIEKIKELKSLTCTLMKEVTEITLGEFKQALTQSSVSKTGK